MRVSTLLYFPLRHETVSAETLFVRGKNLERQMLFAIRKKFRDLHFRSFSYKFFISSSQTSFYSVFGKEVLSPCRCLRHGEQRRHVCPETVMNAYIYSIFTPLSESSFITSVSAPGLSSTATAVTLCYADDVSVFGQNFFAFSASLTIRRSIPKSCVSAIDIARISIPALPRTSVISTSFARLVFNKDR